MFGLIQKVFIGFLTSIVSAFNHTKCVSLSNQKCMAQPTLFNLHPNVKNYTTIHLRLNEIGVLEIVILFMNFLIKYVFQTKQKI